MLTKVVGVVIVVVLLLGIFYASKTSDVVVVKAADTSTANAQIANAQAGAAVNASVNADATAAITAAVNAQAAADAAAVAAAVVKPPSEPTYIGCIADSEDRVLPNYSGDMSWSECKAVAMAAGSKVFAIQYAEGSPGQCFHGASLKRSDPANNCFSRDGVHMLGAAYSNAAYQL